MEVPKNMTVIEGTGTKSFVELTHRPVNENGFEHGARRFDLWVEAPRGENLSDDVISGHLEESAEKAHKSTNNNFHFIAYTLA